MYDVIVIGGGVVGLAIARELSKQERKIALLERVSNMSEEEARKELMDVVETKMADEVAAYIRDKEEEAKEKAAENAREMMIRDRMLNLARLISLPKSLF